MGSSSKNSPKQPDIAPVINQQSALAHMNQFTPYGNITYGGQKKIRIPGQPDAFVPESMSMTLDPAQQRLMDQRNFAQQRLGDLGIGLAGQFSGSPMPQYQGPVGISPQAFRGAADLAPAYMQGLANFVPGDFEASRGAAERAVFDRGMSLMRPELERQEEGLRQRLANQGLPQASQAFDAEMGRFERGRGEQMDRLAQSAVLQGLGAQQQGYGQALGTHQTNAGQQMAAHQSNVQQRLAAHQMNAQNALGAHQQNVGQSLQAHQMNAGNMLATQQAQQAQRAGQLQEILGLFGLQGVNLPQMQQLPQIEAVRAEPQQQQGASPLAGIFGLAGMGLGAHYGGGLEGARFGTQFGTALPGLFGL